MKAFYLPDGDGFRATLHTRGPWSDDFQHGGPPAALLARGFERLLSPGFTVTRLTVEFFRPVPLGLCTVEAEVVRGGRKVTWLAGKLLAEGKEVCRASAVAMRTTQLELPDAQPALSVKPPEDSALFTFPFFLAPEGYHTAMETRIAGGTWASGALAAWMRMRVPLVLDEEPSPLQRVACAADSGGGVSKVLDMERFTFMNADLTIHLHRPAVGAWICLDACTVPHPSGIGLAETQLSDARGPIGRGLQGLLVDGR